MKRNPAMYIIGLCILACACSGPGALPTGTPATAVPTFTATPVPPPTLTPTLSVTPVVVQIVTPPVPPTPVSLWPPQVVQTVSRLRALWNAYGWWTLLLVLVAAALFAFLKLGGELTKTWTKNAVTAIETWRKDLPGRMRSGLGEHERALLKNTLDRYEYLEMKGFVREKVMTASLESVYVPLFTQQAARTSGHSAAGGELGGMLVRGVGGEPTPLTALLSLHRCLVVTGQAGAGKSTFVRHVALTLTRALLERKPALVRQRLDWDVDPIPLPILLPLGGFGLYLQGLPDADKAAPSAGLLLGYMRHHFRYLKLPEDFFPRRFEQECRCLVLLDGLDEVAYFEDRVLISETVTLLSQQYEGTRFVVTCRPEGYRGGAQLGGAFQQADVQPLRWPDDIRAFVQRWNQAVLNATPQAARENAQDLMRRLGEQDQVRALADNPLLLTVMIIVHFNVGSLPDRRAELYDNATDLLLGWDTRWRRTLAAPPPWLDAIKAAGKRLYLEELAYQWQRQGTQEARREDAIQTLTPLFLSGKGEEKERQAAERAGVFVDWVVERSYLLRTLGATLAFHRRAFQEYLAARRLAREKDPVAKTLAAVRENADWWQETVLLALDHLSAYDPERAAALLRGLLDASDDPPGSQGHLVLAGRALAQASREHLPWQLVEETRDRLRDAVEHPAPSFAVPQRVQAGRALAALGDERPGVCARFPVLVEIPGGPFAMGSTPEEVAHWKQRQRQRMEEEREDKQKPIDEELYSIFAQLLDAEEGVHEIELPAFYIARCPVTVAQYRPFVEGRGYEEKRFWTEAGWAWLHGEAGEREEYSWNQERPVERRQEPVYWRDHRLNAPNQPVVGVTWYEALAYCRWLTEQFEAAGCPLQVWRKGQVETVDPALSAQPFRLPTEAEWEKAARGTDRRAWSWGDEWDSGKVNSGEGERDWPTTPVGLYVEGASPYGVLDLVGNTWEWTSTRWGDDLLEPAYPAPYRAGDGREEAAGTTLRVLRGGGWGNDRIFVRCGARFWLDPVYWYDNFGFRVARGTPCAAP